MAINKYDQILSTSADYVHALKTVENIEKAVETTEWWGTVSNFPQYIKAYNNLLERAIATTDAKPPNSENMKVAHKKLTEKLAGLDKRVMAASAKMGVTGPSKDLIQMLKVHEEKKNDDKKDDKKSEWTWTRIAKYSAAGVAAVLASQQIYQAATNQFPDILSMWTPAVAPATQQTAAAMTGTIDVVKILAQLLGKGEDEVRHFLNLQSIPPGSEQTQGAALMMGAAFSTLISNYLITPLGTAIPWLKPVTDYVPSALLAGTLCNKLDPNCTQSLVDKGKDVVKGLEELSKAHPVGYNAIASFLLLGGVTFNKDAIVGFFSATSGFALSKTGVAAGLWYLAKAIDAKRPGSIDAVRQYLPNLQDLSTSGMTAIDTALVKANKIYEANPETMNLLTNAGLLMATPVLGPIPLITKIAYDTGVVGAGWDAAVNNYNTNGTLRQLADAGYPIAKDAASWLNQTFNNPTEWPIEKLIKQNPEVLNTAQWSLGSGITGWGIAPWLFKTGAATAATNAGNTAAAAIPNAQAVVTTTHDALGTILSTQSTPPTADAIAAATAAQNTARTAAAGAARSGYLKNKPGLTASIFALIPPIANGLWYGAPIVKPQSRKAAQTQPDIAIRGWTASAERRIDQGRLGQWIQHRH